MSYPGKPYCYGSGGCRWDHKADPGRENPQTGKEQRVADPRLVADDSGPMKPGNSVEDKTLTTGTKESGPLMNAHQEREVVDEKRG